MVLFSDSLIGICDALSIAMHANFASKHTFSSKVESDVYVIQMCTRRLLNNTNWNDCNYDTILTVEDLKLPTGQNIIGALFLEKKDYETYEVTYMMCPLMRDQRAIDMLLLLMASEVVEAHGGKQLMHYIQDVNWNHKTFTRYHHKMGFFWLDDDGNETYYTNVLSRKDAGFMRPCFKLCRPKFTHSGGQVYFAKCMMYGRENMKAILNKNGIKVGFGRGSNWDIVITCGCYGNLLMQKRRGKTVLVYDVYRNGFNDGDVVVYKHIKDLAQEAAIYDGGEDAAVVFHDNDPI